MDRQQEIREQIAKLQQEADSLKSQKIAEFVDGIVETCGGDLLSARNFLSDALKEIGKREKEQEQETYRKMLQEGVG